MKLKPLSEQTIVITGASSGIGLTTAYRAADEGAKVILVSRNEDALRRICDQIRSEGGRADYVTADVGRREDVRRVVDTVVERHGGFDTWVNDAGIGAYAELDELSDEDHRRIFETNYWGVVHGSTEALRHLRRRGGALINIGSISSDMPAPILSAYTASKHAVKGFTNSLRLELIHEGAPVSLTLIKPSGIQTPFGDHAKNYMDEASQVPPPVYSPDLVADAILYAAENPIREITVGGAGRLMTLFSRLAPNLADQIYARAFYKTARDPSRPSKPGDSLHRPGNDGRIRGEQGGYVLESSMYTSARLHPGRVLGVGAVAALLAMGLTSYLSAGGRTQARENARARRPRQAGRRMARDEQSRTPSPASQGRKPDGSGEHMTAH